MTKRAIIYTRVSTDEQAEHGYSLGTQLAAAQQEAARRGLVTSPDLTFSDDYSGATLERPALTRLRAAVRPGDTIIIYDPDRLSRDDVDFLVICREFDRAGASLVFLEDGDIPEGEEGDIVRYLKGWRGKRERKKIIERSLRGRRAKAASGKWVGSGHPPYGYRRVGERKKSRLVIDEAEADVVRSIFRRFAEGESILGIANALTAAHVPPPNRSRIGQRWYQTSIKRFLRSPIYVGVIEQYGHKTEDPRLAIIPPELWKAVQARLANNRRTYNRPRKHDYLLTGFLNCTCGHRMHGIHTRGKGGTVYPYYICSHRAHRQSDCRERAIPMHKTDSIVWGWLMAILCDDERREAGLREYAAQRERDAAPARSEAESVATLVSKAQRKVNRYAAALGDEEDEIAAAALRQQMNLAAKELASLQARQEKLARLIEQHEISQAKIDEVRRMSAAVRRRLPGKPTHAQKRELLDVLSVQVQLVRGDDGRRWLDISCGVPDWGVMADNHSLVTPSC